MYSCPSKAIIYIVVTLLISASSGYSQTIAEKKAGATSETQDMTAEMHRSLLEVNKELKAYHEELRQLYTKVNILYEQNACSETYQHLLQSINVIRNQIEDLESHWRETSIEGGHSEAYALWHQPETTLGQLVMDYGSQDYVYLVPDDIAEMSVSIDSNLIIPRASWGDMLDQILTQSGVGYKQLNPYLRQLFLLKDDKSSLELITNNRCELELFPPETRVSFVLTPEPAEVRRTWLFLDKFVNPKSTVLQMVGRDILIIGQVAEIQDLLKLYDFVASNKGDKEYKLFPVRRVDVEEMARILAAIFDQTSGTGNERGKTFVDIEKSAQTSSGPKSGSPQKGSNYSRSIESYGGRSENGYESNGLKVIPLAHVAQALFLVGTKEEIRKAEQIIHQVESQVGEARERVIYWYTARHSDPEELAEVLQRVYVLMVRTGVIMPIGPPGVHGPGVPGAPPPGVYGPQGPPLAPGLQLSPLPTPEAIAEEIIEREIEMLPSELYMTSYYQQGNYVVNPAPIEPRGTKAPVYNKNRDNFIVDPKTGSIAMVVEAHLLPKIKELIKKLDVAKRMVQIEALLFERRLSKQNNFGLNLLKIGECAKNVTATCINWNDPLTIPSGILNFIISKEKTCNLPAYDVAYRFLMTQDDIQINASPSVVAVNQTPATIAIVEERSINTGIFNVETAKGTTLEKAFTRAQYGITIDITPTIHITQGDSGEEVDEPNYVTLETDITFDTVEAGLSPDQPDVIRRHINNEVRIPDGQTIILGGLRRKVTDDFKESIPFLGELPAIGKFFSQRELQDLETEMFIFLTPTIISDPLDDFERIKCEEMRRRPGDIPEFLCSLVRARDMEKNRVLANSMEILLGPKPDRCYTPNYFRPSTCGGPHATPSWFIDYLPLCEEYDGR